MRRHVGGRRQLAPADDAHEDVLLLGEVALVRLVSKKLFFFVTDNGSNKLECLSSETLSSQVLEFEGKARANPIGAPFSCFLLGKAPGVTSKC